MREINLVVLDESDVIVDRFNLEHITNFFFNDCPDFVESVELVCYKWQKTNII